jgi:hypothetical protein
MPFQNLNFGAKTGSKVKGQGSPVFQGSQYRYDPSEGVYIRETQWAGSEKSIASLSSKYAATRIGHTAEVQNGVGHLTSRAPLAEVTNQVEERYELVSEFIEKDGFSHPTVSASAFAWDDTITTTGIKSFRKYVEDEVEEHQSIPFGGPALVVLNRMVKHLRNGLTGYERENIIIRRYRKAPGNNPLGWQASILDGKYIYTTAQLGLPSDVAWQLPDITDGNLFPVSIAGELKWGWRRRPTTNVWAREYIEQSSEFVLAEWSLLYYEEATGFAGW